MAQSRVWGPVSHWRQIDTPFALKHLGCFNDRGVHAERDIQPIAWSHITVMHAFLHRVWTLPTRYSAARHSAMKPLCQHQDSSGLTMLSVSAESMRRAMVGTAEATMAITMTRWHP